MKVEKWAKNGQMVQNCYPLSPTKDIRAVDVGKNFSKMTNASGQMTKHTLQSGILGENVPEMTELERFL